MMPRLLSNGVALTPEFVWTLFMNFAELLALRVIRAVGSFFASSCFLFWLQKDNYEKLGILPGVLYFSCSALIVVDRMKVTF